MLKLLVFTSWEEMRRSEGGGSPPPRSGTSRCSQPLLHLGVRQDDLRNAANDGDEVKDVPGVPEIILQKQGERGHGIELRDGRSEGHWATGQGCSWTAAAETMPPICMQPRSGAPSCV